MALIDNTRGSFAQIGVLGQFFANTIAAISTWQDARNTRKALERLSDRELDDIGLCRGDIDAMINRR